MTRHLAPAQLLDDPPVEWKVEPTAGVNLTDSSPWWGSRIYWRVPPARRWEKALLVDVHPFDGDTIEAFLRTQLQPAPPEQERVIA